MSPAQTAVATQIVVAVVYGTLIAVGAALALYLLLSPVTGGLAESARQSLSVATDVKRLSGQPAAAWAVASLRGCLIVPV
jgi:hypothetical protein